MKSKLFFIALFLCTIGAAGWATASLVDDANTIALWHMDAFSFYGIVDFVTDDMSYTNNWWRGARGSGTTPFVAANFLQLSTLNPPSSDPCHPVVIVHSVDDGNALSFSGAQLAFSQNATWKSTYPAFAVDMQFNAQRNTGPQTLLEATNVWNISLSDSDIVLTIYTSGAPRVYTIAGAVSLGNWQHLTASCTAAGHVTFQVDALPAVTGDGLPVIAANASFYMGNTKGSATNWFMGYIDEVKITVPNLTALLFPFTVPAADSIPTKGLWHFDSINATFQFPEDHGMHPARSANFDRWALVGTVMTKDNSTTQLPTCVAPVAEGIGYPGGNPAFSNCAYFGTTTDGANCQVANTAIGTPDGNNMFISCWLRLPKNFTKTGTARTLQFCDRWNQVNLYILETAGTGAANKIQLQAFFWDKANATKTMTFTFDGTGANTINGKRVDPNQWTHVKFTVLNNACTLSINGTVAGGAGIGTFTLAVAGKVGLYNYTRTTDVVGTRYQWANDFAGYIDDFQIGKMIATCGDAPYSLGDFDKNCIVDFKDLKVAIQDWMITNPLPANNGSVNFPNMVEQKWALGPNMSIPQATITPNISGDFNPADWADARTIELVYPTMATAPNIGTAYNTGSTVPPLDPMDFSQYWYVKWDNSYLYVACVTDDNDVAAFDPNRDCPQIGFNFNNSPAHAYLTQAFLWNMPTGNTWGTNSVSVPAPLNSNFYRVNNLAGWYVIQARLAWSDIACDNPAYVPTVGDKHGMLFCTQDHDLVPGPAGSHRTHFLISNGSGVSMIGTPTAWNVMTLVDTLDCHEMLHSKYDLNNDCIVNLGDLAQVAANWLVCSDASGTVCH